jgi:hypothetical protein
MMVQFSCGARWHGNTVMLLEWSAGGGWWLVVGGDFMARTRNSSDKPALGCTLFTIWLYIV